MQRVARLAFAAVVLATGPLVAACDSLETLELFDTKKKLQGERKPVFPEGVPGVTSGIPAELVRGYREPQHADVTDPAKVAAEAAAADSTKPKPKPPAPPKPPAAANANPPAPQRTAAKSPTPPAQSAAATPAAAPPASPPGPPGATPQPWPASQPQAAWPGSPGAGTVAR